MLTSSANPRASDLNFAPGLALLLGAPFSLFFGSLAIMQLGILTNSSSVTSGFVGFFYLVLVFISVLCLYPGVYLAVSVLGVAASIATLAASFAGTARPLARRWRVAAALSLLAIAAFPFVYRYTPALNAAPGYQMLWVTEPTLWDGLTKRAQITLEQRPCTYTLLGWDADVLVFKAACSAGEQVWRYQPGAGHSAELVRETPPVLARLEREASKLVRADGVQPAHVESSTRTLHLSGAALASPDGRYVAVIARHFYGPEDILVIAPAEPLKSVIAP
jgi:hypothetical protein